MTEKFFDVASTISPVSPTGSLYSNLPTSFGFGDSNTSGARYQPTSLDVIATLQNILQPANSSPIGECVSVMVIHDKQSNNGSATPALILQNASYYGHINFEQRDRFDILFDHVYDVPCLAYTTTVGQALNFVPVNFTVPLHDLAPFILNQATGLPSTDDILIMAISQASQVVLRVISRLNYIG